MKCVPQCVISQTHKRNLKTGQYGNIFYTYISFFLLVPGIEETNPKFESLLYQHDPKGTGNPRILGISG